MRKVLLISLLLALSACSSSSHTKQLKALQTIQSWTATARMVGETWKQGTVPDTYAQQALSRSQEEISKEAKDVTTAPDLQPQLLKIHQTIQKMITAIQQRNKATIAPLLQDLSNQQKQLATFAKTQREQQ